jgi:hypothetical protein
MRRVALALLTLTGASLAAVALAHSTSTSDPAGDVKHNPQNKPRYDIVKVSISHSGKNITETVRTKGKVYKQGSPQTPLLWIDVPGKVAKRPGCQYSDYFVADGEVAECGEGPATGKATIKKTSAHTLKFTFSAKALGSPSEFGSAFVVQGFAGKLIIYDRAPNSGFVRHTL